MQQLQSVTYIKDLNLGFSSTLKLVTADNGDYYILKRTPGHNFDQNHKEYWLSQKLQTKNQPFITLYTAPKIAKDEFLLPYFSDSTTLDKSSNPSLYKQFGSQLRSLHMHTSTDVLAYDLHNKPAIMSWASIISDLQTYTLGKIAERKPYTSEQIRNSIAASFAEAQGIPPKISFIHGDMHTGNVLVAKNATYIFDGSTMAIYGDYRYDIASVRISLPGQYIGDSHGEQLWQAFLSGYGTSIEADTEFKDILTMVCARNYSNPFIPYIEELFNVLTTDGN